MHQEREASLLPCRERQRCSVLSRLGAVGALQPRTSHSAAHPHPRAHSQTHPGVPRRHTLWRPGVRQCTWLPPPPPCTPPSTSCLLCVLTASPPYTLLMAQASWGALVGVQVTQVATVGTLRRPCLPRPAPPGRDHRALKPTAASAGPDLPRPTAGHKGFLVETLLALSVREGPGQLAPLRPAPGLVVE